LNQQDQSVDYLIVGQGLAGTLIGWHLEQNGQTVYFVDPAHAHAASKVAAGLINPITGRRMVKSWLIDDLLPKARDTYQAIEQQFNISVMHPKPIIRVFLENGEVNLWDERSRDPLFERYATSVSESDGGAFTSILDQPSLGETKQSLQIDLPLLIGTLRNYWLEKECLLTEQFDFEAMHLLPEGIQYKQIKAKQIIFCEGYKGKFNPFFGAKLPYRGAKGEALFITFPDHQFDRILKHKCFVAPLANNQYWIGSTYDWYYEDDSPTPEGKMYYQELLAKFLPIPYEIQDHRAAIRPTIKDRKPLLGRHWDHPQLILFNGLGTKGASLGPYFAGALTDFLLKDLPLPKEVNLNRFL